MPILASQHEGENPKDPFDLLCDWPEDCTVQWGSSGLVFSKSGTRSTAFFEAFPKGPGFFRGEGSTLIEAEADCFEKYARFAVCDHRWGRGFKVEKESTQVKYGKERRKLRGKTGYTNGGAICKKCGAFASMFHEIVTLGSWKDGPSIHDLTMAAEGLLRPSSHRRDSSHKIYRRSELLLRVAGINLPPTPDTPSENDLFGPPDEYELACRSAVVKWYLKHKKDFKPGSGFSMAEAFSALDHRMMDRLVDEEQEYIASKAIEMVP